MNLISEEYKKQLHRMHSRGKFTSALVKYPSVKEFIETYKPKSVLDYGCASGKLIKQLKVDFPDIAVLHGYDPGVLEFEVLQEQLYDCLISNDVIEHIEPELLNKTLSQMQDLFDRSALLIIACYPAKKKLPDGRNAHLTIQPPDWWIEKIKNIFKKSTIVNYEIIGVETKKLEIRLILNKNV